MISEDKVEKEIITTCSTCGDNIYEGEIIKTIQDRVSRAGVLLYSNALEVCERCYDDSFYCETCYTHFADNRGFHYIESEGISICYECYTGNYFCCNGCDEHYHIDYYRDGYCDFCYGDYEVQCGYYYWPIREWKRLSTNREPRYRGNILYYGIELEVGSKRSVSDVGYDSILSKYHDYIRTTDDCSIFDNCDIRSGCEIVSEPATYNWIVEHRKDFWGKMLKELRSNGVISYKTESCGIHIHMCKDVFTTAHLYRFIKFIYGNPKFVKKISQRGKMGYNWCRFDDEGDDDTIKHKAEDKISSNKYTALNLVHTNTLEIRIFRGTLCESSFYKNIQFLQSLFEYTKNEHTSECTLDRYLRYVSLNKKRFSDLREFITKNESIEKV